MMQDAAVRLCFSGARQFEMRVATQHNRRFGFFSAGFVTPGRLQGRLLRTLPHLVPFFEI